MPTLRTRAFPETAARAQAAQAAAKQPITGWLGGVQKTFYAWRYNGVRAYFERHPDHIAVVWNGLDGSRRAFIEGARDAGARTLIFELAPIKGRITCDPVGVNQANSLPRQIDFYLDWAKKSGVNLSAWKDYRFQITQRQPGRTKPQQSDSSVDGRYIFAPLQVPGDSQLRLFGGNFRTVPDFIDALVAAAEGLPEGWHLKIKEHPTAEVSFSDLIIGRSKKVVLDNQSDTFALVQGAEGVVTVNSSVGLEAMFFDKPVVACGECFWAIDGVAISAKSLPDLKGWFENPSLLGYDAEARAALLSYLLEEYYLPLDPIGRDVSEAIRRRIRKNSIRDIVPVQTENLETN